MFTTERGGEEWKRRGRVRRGGGGLREGVREYRF
jgi:hypothetical protein